MAKKNVSVSLNRKNKTTPYHIAVVNVPRKAKVRDVVVLYNEDTQIILEAEIDEDVYEERTFLSIKLGEELPEEKKLKYLGTSLVQGGHVLEQVYEILN